jgi:hypothetical protein
MRRPDNERSVRQDEDSTMENTQNVEESQRQPAEDGQTATDPLTQPEHNTNGPIDHHSDSDSDAPPEQTSTKPLQPLRVPPPTALSKPQKPLQQEAKPCTSFLAQGRCKFGNKCRYKHDSASTSTSGSGQAKGRKTLFQRVSDAFSNFYQGGGCKGYELSRRPNADSEMFNSLLNKKWMRRINLLCRL